MKNEFKKYGGGTPATNNESFWSGKIPWISSADVYEDDIISINETRFINEIALNNSTTKLIPQNSIIIVSRVGVGKVVVNKDHALCTSQDFTSLFSSNNNPFYFAYLFSKLLKKKISQGSTIKGISSKEIQNLNLVIPGLDEQNKIANFLLSVDERIKLIKRKISTLKKYKKGLENYAYKYVKKHGTNFAFRDLFSPINEKNNLLLKQYTVGKYGIKEMDKGNYDILKHRIFNPTNLIVGIGIEEIGISEHIKGSVSPIYDVFAIKNKSYYDSIRHTLKSQLWSKRNFITKNSTRREYEVDKKELLKVKIFACEKRIFNSISNTIDLNKRNIKLLEQKLNSLFEIKNYLLNNMFI